MLILVLTTSLNAWVDWYTYVEYDKFEGTSVVSNVEDNDLGWRLKFRKEENPDKESLILRLLHNAKNVRIFIDSSGYSLHKA